MAVVGVKIQLLYYTQSFLMIKIDIFIQIYLTVYNKLPA